MHYISQHNSTHVICNVMPNGSKILFFLYSRMIHLIFQIYKGRFSDVLFSKLSNKILQNMKLHDAFIVQANSCEIGKCQVVMTQ